MIYEPVNSPCALCLSVACVDQVLSEIGWSKPTLYVHSHQVGSGHRVAESLGMNLAVDERLSPVEWYVEWNDKRIGTEGI